MSGHTGLAIHYWSYMIPISYQRPCVLFVAMTVCYLCLRRKSHGLIIQTFSCGDLRFTIRPVDASAAWEDCHSKIICSLHQVAPREQSKHHHGPLVLAQILRRVGKTEDNNQLQIVQSCCNEGRHLFFWSGGQAGQQALCRKILRNVIGKQLFADRRRAKLIVLALLLRLHTTRIKPAMRRHHWMAQDHLMLGKSWVTMEIWLHTCMIQPMMKMTKPKVTALEDVLQKTEKSIAVLDMANWNKKNSRKGRPKLLLKKRLNWKAEPNAQRRIAVTAAMTTCTPTSALFSYLSFDVSFSFIELAGWRWTATCQ